MDYCQKKICSLLNVVAGRAKAAATQFGSAILTISVGTLVLVAVFWLALSLHLAFVHAFLPVQVHEWPLHLDFRTCNHRPGLCSEPTATVRLSEGVDSSATFCYSQSRHRRKWKDTKDDYSHDKDSGFEQFDWEEGELMDELLGPKNKHNENKDKQNRGNKRNQFTQPWEEQQTNLYCRSLNDESSISSPGIFSRGQRYTISLHLVMPDSDANRHLGMFPVEVSMLDGSRGSLVTVRRPVLLPYRSQLQRLVWSILRSPYLLFWDSYSEVHELELPVFEAFVDDPLQPAKFLLVTLQSRYLQVSTCRVSVVATFSGLRKLLHRYPLISAAIGTLTNMTVILAAVVVFWLRRMERSQTTTLMQTANNSLTGRDLNSSRDHHAIESSRAAAALPPLEVHDTTSSASTEDELLGDEGARRGQGYVTLRKQDYLSSDTEQGYEYVACDASREAANSHVEELRSDARNFPVLLPRELREKSTASGTE